MNNPFEVIDARLSNIEDLLLDLRAKNKNTLSVPDQEEFLTVSEAAVFLRLSVPTIYTMISKGRIPVIKRSKRCYFLKVDLVNYLKQGRKKSNKEIALEADAYGKKEGGPNYGK